MLKILGALILTPFVYVGILLGIPAFMGFLEEYGDDILGIGFLIGWLVLIFLILYKIL